MPSALHQLENEVDRFFAEFEEAASFPSADDLEADVGAEQDEIAIWSGPEGDPEEVRRARAAIAQLKREFAKDFEVSKKRLIAFLEKKTGKFLQLAGRISERDL